MGIESFGRLKRLPEFNPFTNIEIVNGTGAKVPTIQESGLAIWLGGTRLRQLRDEMGAQQFRRWINLQSNGNTARLLKTYAAFLEPEHDELVTAQTIYETYRQSVTKQLAA
jgi:hypothetical protein